MSEIVYLILARFSLKNHVFRTHLYEKWSDKEWGVFLQERKDLLIEHNLRSLKNQTNKNFEYLLYIDPTFPAINTVLKDLQKIEQENSFVKLQFVSFPWGDGGPNCRFSSYLKKHVYDYIITNHPDCKWLISSRLDTDDLLSRDFVEETYKNFKFNEEWISFENGYCYLKTKKVFIKYKDWASCHIIYCEPFIKENKEVKTVFHRTHSKLGFTRNHSEKIKIVTTPNRGWWLDIMGLDSNLARNNNYLKTESSKRFWNNEQTELSEIRKYVETGEFK